jgi:hypothetical protein
VASRIAAVFREGFTEEIFNLSPEE